MNAFSKHSQLKLSSSHSHSHLSRHTSRLSTSSTCWQPALVAHTLHRTNNPDERSPLAASCPSSFSASSKKKARTHAGAHPVFWFDLCWSWPHSACPLLCRVHGSPLAPIPRVARGVSTFPLMREHMCTPSSSASVRPSRRLVRCPFTFHSKTTSASRLRHDFHYTVRVLPSGMSAICSHMNGVIANQCWSTKATATMLIVRSCDKL